MKTNDKIEQIMKEAGDDIMKLLDLLYVDCDCDLSQIDRIEMNAYNDIAHYKDGTSKIIYSYID